MHGMYREIILFFTLPEIPNNTIQTALSKDATSEALRYWVQQIGLRATIHWTNSFHPGAHSS